MKRKKFIALLCVAATSASLVTPVMAEENLATQNAQEETVADEAISEEEAAEETAQDTVPEESVAPAADAVSVEDASEEKEAVAEEPQEQTQQGEAEEAEEAVQEDGWWNDEYGNFYYYMDGKMVTNSIIEIEEDGVTNGYYLDSRGIMLADSYEWIEIEGQDGSQSGMIRADEDGVLYKNRWEPRPGGNWYYGDDYFCCTNEIVEIDGDNYYFNSDNDLVTNRTFSFNGKMYTADEEGRLTEKDMSGASGWTEIDGDWYVYVDGEPLTNTYYPYNGSTYYLDETGKMQTSLFWDKDGKKCIAEPSGKVITNPSKDWNKSAELDTYYYYEYNSDGVLEPVTYRWLDQNGKSYFIDWEGRMEKGSFWYDGAQYFANENGEIQKSASWMQDKDGNWYYVQKDGTLAIGGIYQVGNKYYKFDWDGEMETGMIWDNEKAYMTDASGAIVYSEGWNLISGEYYYMNNDYSIVRESFKEIGGQLYYFDWNGVMETGTFSAQDEETKNWYRYHADASGAITRNGWYQTRMDYYYADASGRIKVNEWIPGYGNAWYYVNYNGAMVRGSYTIDGVVNLFDNNGKWTGTISRKDGWSYGDGKWYYYKDGEAYTGWVDNKYWVENGMLQTNTYVMDDDDNEYYVNQEGIYQTGWIQAYSYYDDTTEWSYADASGVLKTNEWYAIGNKWYYFMEETMVQDTIFVVDGKASIFAADGHWIGYAKTSNWEKRGEDWYYVNADGSLAKEEQKIGGKTYYFAWNGRMLSNETYYGGENEIWINANGEKDMSNGWKVTKNNTWYYVENGSLKQGWLSYGGNWYYFGNNMYTGIDMVENNGVYEWAFFDSNGVYHELTNGWKSVKKYNETVWYYVKNGTPASGYVDGYYFYEDGEMITGQYHSVSGAKYFFDENGKQLKGTGWYYSDGSWFYINQDGTLATGERTIGGKKYWFNNNGYWIK